jgi:PmbA protein
MAGDREANYADQLSDFLGRAERGAWQAVPKLQGWWFDVNYINSVSLSLEENRLGDVYGPVTARESLGGALYLVWEDGQVSNVSVNRLSLPEFEAQLQKWRASAYEDEQAAPIHEPDPVYPEVEMYDPAINALVEGDPDLLFKIIKAGEEELRGKGGMDYLDAEASASSSIRFLRNSRGLDISYPATIFSYAFYYGDVYGNGYTRRKLAPEEEFPRIIEDVRETAAQFRRTGTFRPDPVGNRVILETGLAGMFIGQFIGNNLDGANIVNSNSAYSLEDFQARRQVIRPDISLVIDGLRPFEASSSRATSEGVPGGRGYLVEKGRLAAPSLDLKYAKITGYAPTCGGGLYVKVEEGGQHQSFKEMIRQLDYGLVVYSVMGMHTQNSTIGRFSLAAPYCLVVENGEFKGKVSANLSGNFFDTINDSRTRFSWAPNESNPAMEIVCYVVESNGE